MSEITDILDRYKRLKSDRGVWESHWQELAEILLPRRADFTTTTTPGEKRTKRLYDGTPMQAARGLAAAIDGMLKPKAARWFSIKAEDEELNELDEVKRWLQAAEERQYAAMYNPKARFLQESTEVDTDLAVFGTGVMFVGEAVGRGRLQFRHHHLREVFVAEDESSEVDTLFRAFTLTARQAVQRWGADQVGPKVNEALKDEPDKAFPFLHVVRPRFERDPRKRDSANMPVASLWIDVSGERKVAEGGFADFPYIVARWETAGGEAYGRSPGMLALPDANTLNQMGKTLLVAGQKAVDPPLLVADESVIGAPRAWPGGLTYFDAEFAKNFGGRPPITPLNTGANLPLGLELEDRRRDMVWAAFFRNVLNLPVDAPQMTATEVLERKSEFMRTIAPTFGRLEADYTAPLVERVFNVMLRAGAFPEPPEALRGRNVVFEYASPITKVQKQIEAAALRKTADDISPIVAVNPGVLDIYDHEMIARDISEANGLPARWLLPPERVQAVRQAKAEAQAEELAKDDAERAVGGVKQLAEAAKAAAGAGAQQQ